MARSHQFLRLAFRTLPFRVGLLLLVLSVPLAVTGLREVFPRWRLDYQGSVTQGVIAGKRIEHVARKDRSGKLSETTSYVLTYDFGTPGRGIYEGRQAVSVASWKSMKEGSQVAVRYLPSSPDLNRLDREPFARTPATMLAVVGALLAVIAVVLIVSGGRQAKTMMADVRGER